MLQMKHLVVRGKGVKWNLLDYNFNKIYETDDVFQIKTSRSVK